MQTKCIIYFVKKYLNKEDFICKCKNVFVMFFMSLALNSLPIYRLMKGF